MSDIPKNNDSRNEIVNAVLEQVRAVIPQGLDGGLDIDSSLDEFGLDSLTKMDVVNQLEKVFGIRFSEESLYDMETCLDLVEGIEERMNLTSPARKPAESKSKPAADPKNDSADGPADNEIPSDSYDVTQFAECLAFQQRLDMAAAAGFANPFFRVTEAASKGVSMIGGHETIRYTSFDYLGMAHSPEVAEAATQAIQQFGTSASASRLVGGDNTVIEELDVAIAQFIGTDAAATFPSGFGTNASVLGHLFGPKDLIVYDELAHNSIVQGSLLSKAAMRPFPHNDADFLDELLEDIRGNYRRVVIAIEGVYSMDGDFPDLPKFIDIKRRHKAVLYVDEAHSLGTMGPTGRGICEHYGVDAKDGDLWMGTISKALGSAGGFIAGPEIMTQYLKYTTPSFVFATGASPANAAAALAAVRLLQKEPERVDRLRERSQLFLSLAKASGLDTGQSDETPVIPIILGNSMLCLQVSHELLQEGVDAQPILYPAVAESASRVRFFITADHTEDQIRSTVELLTASIKKNS